MYILNKKTGSVQECSNLDVIKSCKKDTEGYAVSESGDELIERQKSSDKAPVTNLPKALKDMKVDELKALAEEKGIEGYASLTKEELLAVLKDVV